jgi:lipopolysaccharide export system permease protein
MSAKDVTITFADDSLSAMLRMKNIIEERKIVKDKMGDFAITTAASAEINLQLQEQIPNYSSTAPSEMPLSSLSRQIEDKQQRLERRLDENRAQQAIALDRLRMSYAETARANNIPTYQHSSRISAALNSIDSLSNQKIYDASLQVYRLEYQKKFVIPSACFFFAFLAFPLGIGSKRAGRMAGFGLALLLAVIYWAFLFVGQTLGYRQGFNPVISMWMPNIIMVFATFVLWIARKITSGHFL